MSLRIAFQMDPIERVDIDADSTFRLAEEAQARGHEIWVHAPERLSFVEGKAVARARRVTLRRERGNHVTVEEEKTLDLATMDVVWLRQDPPFDMFYITTTHLLEAAGTVVLNDPFWVRNSPEKLLVLKFPDLIPPTVISRDLDVLRAFKEEHGDMILKPLYGNGGAGVFRLGQEDRNLSSLHELFASFSREPLIAQKYLPAVTKGDKRVILIDGEAAGAINRVPAEGETRSNMHVGGRAEKSELTNRDREICAAIGPTLKERGQLFVGIDVIGDYLTEINVTSPTGLQEMERFDGVNYTARIWEAAEAAVAARD
ncbi:glutathione synthase [Roseicyclus sp. F158]|uniref:Glutathione synthetase n=1 Tax=Tropicimonas omnivorans TaxID=3075590 RepID=A0ABU3DFG0_9RHOB|nr:glutathione synthase [Roseicyclus sp. F158]MDT0682451.1 glutathione synthase [Roseicyclus sp. F158]